MGKHESHCMDANSMETHQQNKAKFGHRCTAIVKAFSAIGEPATDRQIMAALGSSDSNFVRPRITELVEIGVLVKAEDIRCPITGRKVRACKLSA